MPIVHRIEQWVSRPVFRTAYAMGLTGLVVFFVLVWVRGGPARQYTAQASVAVVGPVKSVGQGQEIVAEMSSAVHRQMRLWCKQVAPAALAWDVVQRGAQSRLCVWIDVTAPSTGAACATANAAALEALKTGKSALAVEESARQRRRLESALAETRHYETKARHAFESLSTNTGTPPASQDRVGAGEQSPLAAEESGTGEGSMLGADVARSVDAEYRMLAAELDKGTARRKQAELALRLAEPTVAPGRWESYRARVIARSSGRPTVVTTLWTLLFSAGVACVIGTWIVRGRLYRVWASAREVEIAFQTPMLARLSRPETNPLVPAIQNRRRMLDGWITGCEFGLAITLLVIVIFAAMGNHASADLVRDPLAMLAQRFAPVSYGTP